MSERQAKFAKEGMVQQNDGQSLEWGQVRPGALGSFAESSGNDLKRGDKLPINTLLSNKLLQSIQTSANLEPIRPTDCTAFHLPIIPISHPFYPKQPTFEANIPSF
jgi:hypothetical protein